MHHKYLTTHNLCGSVAAYIALATLNPLSVLAFSFKSKFELEDKYQEQEKNKKIMEKLFSS